METTRLELRRVRNVMSAQPVSVTPGSRFEDLMRLFTERDVEILPVVEEDGRLIGVVSKLDLLRALRPAALRGRPDVLETVGTEAREIMRPGVVSVEADDPIVAAIDLMLETRFHGLPVVSRARGGPPRLVGMVSRGDLMRAFL